MTRSTSACIPERLIDGCGWATLVARVSMSQARSRTAPAGMCFRSQILPGGLAPLNQRTAPQTAEDWLRAFIAARNIRQNDGLNWFTTPKFSRKPLRS